MRKWLLALLCLLCGIAVQGQIPQNDPNIQSGVRLSFALDHKIRKRLHLLAENEIRESQDLLSEGSFHSSAGLSYKINPLLKSSASYTLIGERKSRRGYQFRHRVQCDLRAQVQRGPWKWSLREGLQLTHRPGEMNRWQNPRNLLELKSRIKLNYRFNKRFSLYESFEIKTVLNGVASKDYHYDRSQHRYVTPAGTAEGQPGWFFDGYRDVSLQRFRLNGGFEHKWNKHLSYTVYLLTDYRQKVKIDASSDGTRLKSLIRDRRYAIQPGLRCSYSF